MVKVIGVVLLPYFGLFLAPLVSPLAFAVTVGILLGFGLGLEFSECGSERCHLGMYEKCKCAYSTKTGTQDESQLSAL